MKAKYLLFIFLAITTFYLSSCQKELSYEINGSQSFTDSTSSSDSNYLDKIYTLYDIGSGIDTQEVFTLKYDAHKRIISVHDSVIAATGNEHYSSYYFFYNGTDTICNKSIEVLTETATDLDSTITFYFYDGNLKKVKDSIIDISYISGVSDYRTQLVSRYTYAGSLRYGASSGFTNYMLPPSLYTITKMDTATNDSRNNFIAINHHEQIISSLPSNSYSDLFTTYFYDTHSNPFAKLSFFKALEKGDRHYFYPLIISTNNVTKDEDINAPASDTYNYSYQYNNAGFPFKCIITGPDSEQILFRYKSL